MHKVKQKPGGCVAACLASILECGLESVPAMELANPGQGDWDCYWIDRVAPWLAERGLCLQASAGSDAPCGYVIGIIESDVDGAPGHAVVLLDSRLEWDPSELMIGQIELSGTLAFLSLIHISEPTRPY